MLRFHVSPLDNQLAIEETLFLSNPPAQSGIERLQREREREGGGLHQNKPICASKQFNGNVSKPTARAQISL